VADVPIEVAIAINEAKDYLQRETGLNVVDIQLVDGPSKADVTWISADGVASNHFQIARAFIVAGVECLVMACRKGFASHSPWDIFIVTRDGGYQMWPPDAGDAYEVPDGIDIKEASAQIMHQFLLRYPGDEKFLAWIKKCDAMNAKEAPNA
jgi:hypothetical protein